MTDKQVMYSENQYLRILKAIVAEGYRPSRFVDSQAEKAIFLRHDIDWSMDYALRFAEIDADHGIHATFAFLLRGASYNLLEVENKRIVHRIRDMGHSITLHYPAPTEQLDFETLRSQIQRDHQLMEAEFGSCDKSFAWHNTSPWIMEITHDFEVAGLTNIYNRKFLKEMPYRSDSNMRNSIEALLEVIAEGHPKLHLLLHPYMWLSKGNSLTEKMLDVIRGRWLAVDRLGLENRDYKSAFPSGVGPKLFDELINKALSQPEN